MAGNVECMRVLSLVKLSARRNRTVALNQMHSIVATGPKEPPSVGGAPE
jgi:hypothetical protein